MGFLPRIATAPTVFSNAPRTQADTIADLKVELTQARERIRSLELDLSEERAKVARLKRAEKLRADPHPPHGDRDKGFFCSTCLTEFEHPYEDCYCSYCGKAVDWNGCCSDDDDAFDRRFDR